MCILSNFSHFHLSWSNIELNFSNFLKRKTVCRLLPYNRFMINHKKKLWNQLGILHHRHKGSIPEFPPSIIKIIEGIFSSFFFTAKVNNESRKIEWLMGKCAKTESSVVLIVVLIEKIFGFPDPVISENKKAWILHLSLYKKSFVNISLIFAHKNLLTKNRKPQWMCYSVDVMCQSMHYPKHLG